MSKNSMRIIRNEKGFVASGYDANGKKLEATAKTVAEAIKKLFKKVNKKN